MLTNWLQRAAGFPEGAEVPIEKLIPTAAQARRCGVVVDPLSFLALAEWEREALALADAAIRLDAEEEVWAGEVREGVRRAKSRS